MNTTLQLVTMCGKTEQKDESVGTSDSQGQEGPVPARQSGGALFLAQGQRPGAASLQKKTSGWENNSSNFTFHEDTISLLIRMLMTYGLDFSELSLPFDSEKAQTDFVVLCLKLLNGHCSLLVQRMSEIKSGSSLEKKMNDLRGLFFRMLDMDLPVRVQQAVGEALTTGGTILLPSLKEKVRISLGMLNDVNNLSRGQSLLCKVIFTSLEDHQQVSSILALARPTTTKDLYGPNELQWTQDLMSRILEILAEEMSRRVSLLRTSDMCDESDLRITVLSQKLHDLLTTLQNHIFAHCSMLSSTHSNPQDVDLLWKFLETHLSQVFIKTANIYRNIEDVLTTRPEAHIKIASKYFSFPFDLKDLLL